jgi:hypothetical protein
MMKIISRRSMLLGVFLIAWAVSVVLVSFPNLGSSTPVFPTPPVDAYKLGLMMCTTAAASLYSIYLGVKWIKQ